MDSPSSSNNCETNSYSNSNNNMIPPNDDASAMSNLRKSSENNKEKKLRYNESGAYWGSARTSNGMKKSERNAEVTNPKNQNGRRNTSNKMQETDSSARAPSGFSYTRKDTDDVTKSFGRMSISKGSGSNRWKKSTPTPSSSFPQNRRLSMPEATDLDNWRSNTPTLSSLIDFELEQNVFSVHYQEEVGKKPKKSNQTSSSKTLKALQNYKHKEAIQFAAKSYEWLENSQNELTVLPREQEPRVRCYEPDDEEMFAFYRVIVERSNGKYTLMACHVNMHGLHRGDLRFIEVNDRTKVRGLECSVFEGLFIGDIVAVLELAVVGEFVEKVEATEVTHESKCSWMAKRMTLMPRKLVTDITFSFLENRKAIVAGFDETMNVERLWTAETGKIYKGSAFLPVKMENWLTTDFQMKNKNAILSKAAKLSTYPNAFGEIYTFTPSEEQNEFFRIGTDAFKEDQYEEDRDIIVETCAIMGYSAATTVFNGRFDCRAFTIIEPQRQGGNILKFQMKNPSENPTLDYWNVNTKIVFGGAEGDFNATIETVVASENMEFLQVSARLSRDVPKNLNFATGSFIVSQKEPPATSILEKGFFESMDLNSNGRKVIETLYGGPRIELKPPKEGLEGPFVFPGSPPVSLNKYQNEYVSMLLNGNPMVIGSSPFGCGKSMTIVTAAFEMHKRNCELSILRSQEQQLLITQSNYASVNLIDIAKKAHLIDAEDVRFVRYVTENNWRDMPEQCQTDYDMPYLMEKLFVEWALGEENRQTRLLTQDQVSNIVAYILEKKLLSPKAFIGKAASVYKLNGEGKQSNQRFLVDAFFLLYQPDIIMITADTSLSLIKKNLLKKVSTVQIDEASQLPEYTLLSLLVSFPDACFGLIGDIHQLPPYCQDNLSGKLKEYGIGNTMERAIREEMFPQAILRYIYRCHPKTTQLLSELFYDGKLLSGVTENMRNEFMRNREDMWPNFNFPVVVIDNEEPGYKMGTSIGNKNEVMLVKTVVDRILKPTSSGYSLKATDVGVISFYAAQTSVLTEALRGSGVKCGTVDSFQGTEKEVIILCCTNERPSEFMQLANRLNVAMSRARQATIIIGNVQGLRKATFWKNILQRVEEHGCLMNWSL